jgi:hypothetical protein
VHLFDPTDALLMLPVLLLVLGVVAVMAWFLRGAPGSASERFAAWLGLVTITAYVGSAIAFVALHAILFLTGSTELTGLGFLVVTIFMLLQPFGWWIVLHRRRRSTGGT